MVSGNFIKMEDQKNLQKVPKIKVSDYILNYLRAQGINHVFLIIGGFISPLVNSFDKEKNLDYVCTTHEQGAAMAADSYSRITKNLGVAMATSGPGATNLLTGVACSYFDSIPVLYITGQVNTKESSDENSPRQIGFQETDIVSIAKPITKFSQYVKDPKKIKYFLDKAIHIAKSGRPGPVLLDLPIDVQLAEINPSELDSYLPSFEEIDLSLLDQKVDQTIELIQNAKRPIIILGAGVKIGRAEEETRNLIERLGIPVVLSWGGIDILPNNHSLRVGGFGVAAGRVGNFAVQNSDLIISLGSRLDTRQTGGRPQTFARGAKKVILDIHKKELNKGRGIKIDIELNYNITDFLKNIQDKKIETQDLDSWKEKIRGWKEKYPICLPEYFNQKENVNPYVFMDVLSDKLSDGEIIVVDTGNNLSWTMQGFKIKENQRLFSDLGHASMGYALPGSMGACFANNKQRIICIIGDGGLKMNINEFETIVKHNLPIKVFVLNNHGYGMLKQFQDVWFKSSYKASSIDGGLGDPDFSKIAEAYGMKTVQISNNQELNKIYEVLNHPGPVLCNLELDPNAKTIPKLEFGKPLEDSSPLLDRDEFRENMIVKPLE